MKIGYIWSNKLGPLKKIFVCEPFLEISIFFLQKEACLLWIVTAPSLGLQVVREHSSRPMLGQVRLGQVRLSQIRLGQVRLGQVRLGQVRLGQVRLGQVRLGQARLGQARLGQARLGQVRLGYKAFSNFGNFLVCRFFLQ